MPSLLRPKVIVRERDLISSKYEINTHSAKTNHSKKLVMNIILLLILLIIMLGDHLSSDKRVYLLIVNQKKRICQIVNFAVPYLLLNINLTMRLQFKSCGTYSYKSIFRCCNINSTHTHTHISFRYVYIASGEKRIFKKVILKNNKSMPILIY